MCIINPAQAEQDLGDNYHGADNMWCVVDKGGRNTFYLCGDDESLNKINKEAMKKCFPCQTQEHFKECVEADGVPTDTNVRKSCLLPITD